MRPHGADIDARDGEGATALLDAAAFNSPAMVEAILALGADAGLQNDAGQTAYDLLGDNPQITESDDVYDRLRQARTD